MEARADERARFRSAADKYRRHQRVAAVFLVTGLVAIAFAGADAVDRPPSVGFFFTGCVLAGIVTMIFAPRPRCPQCQEDAADGRKLMARNVADHRSQWVGFR